MMIILRYLERGGGRGAETGRVDDFKTVVKAENNYSLSELGKNKKGRDKIQLLHA